MGSGKECSGSRVHRPPRGINSYLLLLLRTNTLLSKNFPQIGGQPQKKLFSSSLLKTYHLKLRTVLNRGLRVARQRIAERREIIFVDNCRPRVDPRWHGRSGRSSPVLKVV